MLYTQTVEPRTFSLLNELLEVPTLQEFCLVGGTALSLLYGHRKSIDLDLFNNQPFKNEKVVEGLRSVFKDRFEMESKQPRFAIFCYVDNIKVDLVKLQLPFIRPIQTHEGIRMFSTEDIIAIKVEAIFNQGKKKDFWDIAELLQHYTVEDFVNFHQVKYSQQNMQITVPEALTYFADAEESEDPVSLKGQTWGKIKAFINKKVSEHLR